MKLHALMHIASKYVKPKVTGLQGKTDTPLQTEIPSWENIIEAKNCNDKINKLNLRTTKISAQKIFCLLDHKRY